MSSRPKKKVGRADTAAKASASAVQKQSEQIALHTQQLQVTNYQGPIPPPEHLQRYESICPGAAQAILDMAKGEATHRHQMEKGVLEFETLVASKEYSQRGSGLKMGFAVAVLGLALTAYLATIGAAWLAGAIGISDLALLCYAFIYGSKQGNEPQKKE